MQLVQKVPLHDFVLKIILYFPFISYSIYCGIVPIPKRHSYCTFHLRLVPLKVALFCLRKMVQTRFKCFSRQTVTLNEVNIFPGGQNTLGRHMSSAEKIDSICRCIYPQVFLKAVGVYQ